MEPLPFLGAISSTLKVNLLLSAVVIFLLFCSAFFSGAETSFSSISLLRMKTYAEEKRKGALKGLYIIEHYEKALITILVGNNLVNIASTTIFAYILSTTVLSPTLANILNTVVMTIVILTFGEITPKCMAKENPEKKALKYANLLFFLMKVLTPLTYLFQKLQQVLSRKNANAEKTPTITENELESIIDTMQEEGVIDQQNAELFQGVLDLGEKTAYDVMTPRVDVVAVEQNDSNENVQAVFVDTQYSRLPVYSEDVDHIVGILSQKDFFTALLKHEKVDIKKIMVKPMFLNENMKLDDVIRKMQSEKKHMAVISDEHGGTCGIITLEDAIEEMFGEIYDEHDEVDEGEELEKVSDTEYVVDAEMDIEDLFKQLEIEHLPETQYSTIGGFLFELAESMPFEGQELEFETVDDIIDGNANLIQKPIKMKFKITEVEENRIRKVLITIEKEDENGGN